MLYFDSMMKTVICHNAAIAGIYDAFGNLLPNATVKAPERGKSYTVTGEITIKGIVYYLLMGFGIKTAFKADKFQDA